MIQQDDFDFGFSAVSEDDLKAMERELQQQVAAKDTASKSYEEKLHALHAMVMPLLNNLAKDDDNKSYIHWPDRQKKMKAFISKINKLMNG